MNVWGLGLTIGLLAACTLAFIWVARKLAVHPGGHDSPADAPIQAAERDVEHLFDDEFRQELRNRGRLHFEKIITENAMFLQQDLRLTTAQLNDYMKTEITSTLEKEFSKYEESIADAKQLAMNAINKTTEAIEQQRQLMSTQLQAEVATEKKRQLDHFSDNMVDIVNHYVMAAIGNQIDLNDQLEYITNELAANKDDIMKDINNGA